MIISRLARGHRFRRGSALALVALASALVGCDGNSGVPADGGAAGSGGCIAPLSLKCEETYEPTYDLIYSSMLRPMCATGSVCHYGPTPNKAPLGLVLSNHDDAYDYLLGKMDGHARVVPSKPECSILVQRIESNDPTFRMPSGGDPLPLGDRCVVRKWIAAGAKP